MDGMSLTGRTSAILCIASNFMLAPTLYALLIDIQVFINNFIEVL